MATATDVVQELHANSRIEKVSLAKLRLDRSYQREQSETLIDLIANDWDVVASELILVSDRGNRPKDGDVEGGLFIVNGQHRSKAAAKKGLTEIDARIMDLRKHPDPGMIEAGFRLKTNVGLADRPLERFKAQVRAGNEESIAIAKLLDRYGTFINPTSNDTGINAVATIEALYRGDDDGILLGQTLEVIKDAWKEVGGKNTQASLLKGLWWFIAKHANESDRTRLVSKLQGIGLAGLLSRSRQMQLTMNGALWVNYYRVLVDLYNEGLRERNRLNWMLRGKQVLAGKGGGNKTEL